jgi:hypothetical protein
MFDKRYPGAAARLAETLTVTAWVSLPGWPGHAATGDPAELVLVAGFRRPLVPISVTATLGVPPLQAPKRSAGWTCPPG